MTKNDRDYDVSQAYAEGVRDGRSNDYSPPHDKGLLGDLFSMGHTKDEIEDRSAYNEGWSRGSNGR